MRKIALFIAVLSFFAITFKANAQLKMGLDLGANISNLKYDFKDSDSEPSTKSLIAPRVGLAVDLKIPVAPIGFETGVFYSGKGANFDIEDQVGIDTASNYDGISKTSISYIEVPLHVKFSMLKVLRLYVGPYAAMGIGGKRKDDYSFNTGGQPFEVKSDEKIEFIDEVNELTGNYFKSMDMGLDFGIGVRVPKLGIHAGYSLGLANISPDYKYKIETPDPTNPQQTIESTVVVNADDVKTKNGAIQFGLTYYF